jgi:hypothetical protein
VVNLQNPIAWRPITNPPAALASSVCLGFDLIRDRFPVGGISAHLTLTYSFHTFMQAYIYAIIKQYKHTFM